MASTGPLSTCCFTARNSTYNGSPAHSRINLYRRKVNQADNIFSATLSVLKDIGDVVKHVTILIEIKDRYLTV